MIPRYETIMFSHLKLLIRAVCGSLNIVIFENTYTRAGILTIYKL